MVQGTSSWAGKSLITTALCRHFARRGMRVAPFKAQNMSNNARVVAGGEIGTAQWLQALAARVEPEVRMNPVLVKPEGDTRSQVVVRGVADPVLTALPWRERTPVLWPVVAECLASLLREFDLIVLEGAGSPAEINLADCDMTNLRSAATADASVLLVCDIDRGGAFAHLYGTWALLGAADRERIRGFVLNRFRGDAALLADAPERLTALTGVPLAGVVPWLAHGLPDEDGVAPPNPSSAPTTDRPSSGTAASDPDEFAPPAVAIVTYPTASNLDEFKPLEQVARVRYARAPSELAGADLVVLPGSKHVAADLRWLRGNGFVPAVRAAPRVLGICGGLQMLGRRLEGEDGLGLLPLTTTFACEKLVERAEVRFSPALGDWHPLAGLPVRGYEIRHGRTRADEPVAEALPGGRGWVRGGVLGVTLHGLFENPDVVAALAGRAPARSLDAAIDELTDGVVAALDIDLVERLAGCR
jgi:adenosylcobyric acid synthase